MGLRQVFAMVVLLTSANAWGQNATISFVSEQGFPHSCAVIQASDGTVRWLGFIPKKHRAPVSDGVIDGTVRQSSVEDYVSFRLKESVVLEAERATRQSFDGKRYELGIRDCVSFTAELARQCGLNVDPRPNFLPKALVQNLGNRNTPAFRDIRPFPWVASAAGGPNVQITIEMVHCIKTETVTGPDRPYLRLYRQGGIAVDPGLSHRLNDGEKWILNRSVLTLPRGEAFAIQVWDDDRLDPDDLVFDWSLAAPAPGRLTEAQTRGTSINGSESRYEVTIRVSE